MRSRFSAYCEGSEIAIHYLANSYHPSSRVNNPIAEIAAFAKAAHFVELQVLGASDMMALPDQLQLQFRADHNAQQYQMAWVHFKVRFIMQDKLHLLEENSRFIYSDGRWTYLDGTLYDHPPVKLSRNDSCPCRSGKKYKQCRPHQIAGQKLAESFDATTDRSVINCM